MKRRIVLGRYSDASEGAAMLSAEHRSGKSPTSERKRSVGNAVERVRRHFGRNGRAAGNRYAKVAYAYFQHRSWYKTGLPKSSFFHALKKIKEFFEADKHWAGLTNRYRRRRR